MLKSLITPWRLRWYSVAVLLGIFLAVAIVLASGRGSEIISGRLGGDFTSFYAAGRTVGTSGFDQLYDLDHQEKSQKDLYPDHETGFLPFPYPPFVAQACVLLSYFSYRTAYVLHLLLSIGAFFVAFVCINKIIHGFDAFFLPVFALSLTFYPFLKAVLNGQVSAMIFMLYALIWWLVKNNRHYLAGFSMAFLIFKPQFAIPLIGVFLLSGRLKTVVSALGTACLMIAVSLLFSGIQPYEQWYELLKWFVPADANNNGYNAVSWIGFLDAVFGTDNRITFIIGYICCFSTVMVISGIWAVGGIKSDFDAQMALAAVSFVLIPPHLMYYDAGLIVLTYMVLIPKIPDRKIELIGLVWLSGWTQIFADQLGFSPLFFLVIFTFFFSLVHIGRRAVQYKITNDNHMEYQH